MPKPFPVWYPPLLALLLYLLPALQAHAQPPPEAELAREYVNEGDYEKALNLYQKLSRQFPDDDSYLLAVMDCQIRLKQADDAAEQLSRLAKKRGPASPLHVATGYALRAAGHEDKAANVWNDLIDKRLKTLEEFEDVGAMFTRLKVYDRARQTFEQGRRVLRSDDYFSQQLSDLYYRGNDMEKATEELLKSFLLDRSLKPAVRTILTSWASASDPVAVEKGILSAINRYPGEVAFKEMLLDLYIEIENFEEALIQARSLDKQLREGGHRLFQLSETLQNNRQYDLSNQALDYVIAMGASTPYYYDALSEKTKNLEAKAFDKRTPDTTAIRQAVQAYDQLIRSHGNKPNFVEAMYRKARLCLFYLNDLPCAEQQLTVIESMGIQPMQKAEAKLLRGDIELLRSDYKKADLLYDEVDRQFREGQLGNDARLRMAKLDYYRGDFESARERLKVLKDNTSNAISNDAIQLLLTIQDNTGLDSNTTALSRFSFAQLLLWQHRLSEALVALDSLAYEFPNHPLQDDILWAKIQAELQLQHPDKALELANKLLEKYGSDVLGDDALMLKAELFDFQLNDKAKAQEAYLQLLRDYPGSVYKVEARKRIRALRGQAAKP